MLKHRINYGECLRRLICPELPLESVVKVKAVQTEVRRSIRKSEIMACKEKSNKVLL